MKPTGYSRWLAYAWMLAAGCATSASNTDAMLLALRERVSSTQRVIDSLAPGAEQPNDTILVGKTPPTGDEAERRFSEAAKCDSAMPGVIRGLLEGRFDEPGIPTDTLLKDALVYLSVETADGAPFERSAMTGSWGQFYMTKLPPTGHYRLRVWHVLVQDPPFDLVEGFIQDLQARCLLPSTDGRVPVSARLLGVVNTNGLGGH